jgi:hypothetical protein
MNNKIMLLFLAIFLIFSPVSAQSLFTNWNEWLNIPADWTRPPNLIYYVLVPFFGTFAIIWGILTGTKAKVFDNKRVNILLSFIFAIALFATGIMPAIVLYLFMFGGAFGVIAFFVLFFVLTTLFGTRKIEREYLKTMKIHEKVAKEGIEETIKTRKGELNKLEKIRKKKKDIEKKLSVVNNAILASNHHIKIIRDPTTTARKLMDSYGTDNTRRAEEKILRLLRTQKDKKISLQRELRKLEKEEEKLLSI